MRRDSAYFYLDKLEGVAEDFVRHLRLQSNVRDSGTGAGTGIGTGTGTGTGTGDDDAFFVTGDFLKEAKKYSFESVALVATNRRLGILQSNQGQQVTRESILITFTSLKLICSRPSI